MRRLELNLEPKTEIESATSSLPKIIGLGSPQRVKQVETCNMSGVDRRFGASVPKEFPRRKGRPLTATTSGRVG